MNPAVSIIVPTYNRAHSLPKVVNTLLSQSYQDFELIIVNDGSKDNTKEVLETFANRDARVKPVIKQNGGVSSARNTGIEKASGEFIIFVDDDDDLTPDYIKNLMIVEPSIDLVIDSYSNQIDEGPINPSHFPIIHTDGFDNILNTIFGEMQKYRYCLFPIAKRYRLSIIKEHNIKFRKDITLGEDRPFILDYLRHANSLQIIDTHSYIVKNVTNSEYRLSQGAKPAEYLIRNFRESYKYLINYGKEFKNQLILNYADNYIAEKSIDYLLIPMMEKRHTADSERLINIELPKMLTSIKLSKIKSMRNKMIVSAVRCLGVQPAVSIMRAVFKFCKR